MSLTLRRASHLALAAVAFQMAAQRFAHQSASAAEPASKRATPAPAKDLAPGARPEERNRLLEAQWTEAIVKARKAGAEVVAAVKLVKPQIKLFHAAAPPDPDAENGGEKKKPTTKPAGGDVIDLAPELRKITPLDVDHIDILDGEVTFVDTSRKERPELWLHDLQLSIENLPTRVQLTEGRPVLLTMSGTLASSGSVSIFLTADPFEQGLTFSGRASIVGLQTSELHKFIEPATGLQAPHGTIDIFVEFDCRNGELTGGVKPVLKNVDIRPNNKKLLTVLKAWITDFAVNLFSDRVRQRNAIATVIPIKGTLGGPDVQLWPTIFGVLRNAFVEGLTSGYAHLPPRTDEKKESVVKQGVDALTGSAPPKAQPTQPAGTPPEPTAPTAPQSSTQSKKSP